MTDLDLVTVLNSRERIVTDSDQDRFPLTQKQVVKLTDSDLVTVLDSRDENSD